MPRKLAKHKREEIRKLLKSGHFYKEIAEKVGCYEQTVSKYAEKWGLQHDRPPAPMFRELSKDEKDEMRELLEGTDKSYKDIADIVGCHHDTVGRYARKWGLNRSRTISEEKKRKLKELLSGKKHTYKEIAQMVDISYQTVYKYAKRWDMQRRSSTRRREVTISDMSGSLSYYLDNTIRPVKRDELREELYDIRKSVKEKFKDTNFTIDKWHNISHAFPSLMYREAVCIFDELVFEYNIPYDVMHEVIDFILGHPQTVPKMWKGRQELIRGLIARELKNRGCKLPKELKSAYSTVYTSVDGIVVTPPTELVERIGNKVGFSERDIKEAKKLANKAEEKRLHDGRKPRPIAGACLYEINRGVVTQDELAEVCGCTDITLRHRLREIESIGKG